ncbi:MAG: hypothetical protein AB7I57_17200 [Pirellulales bacterium]
MFDRLRRSYGETASLGDRPGQLFTGDESDDLTSFLQLSALFGWGGYLLTEADQLNAFFSHHEYIDLFAHDHLRIEQLRDRLPT